MRRVIGTIAALVAIAGCGTRSQVPPRFSALPLDQVEAAAPWAVIEATAVEWNGGGTAQIVIEQSDDEDSPRLRIVQKGRSDYVVAPPGGIAALRDRVPVGLLQRNDVSSARLLVPRDLRTSANGAVVMIAGRAFASDPGSFYALAVSPGHEPRELFSSTTFALTELQDLDDDGVTEIVGKHSLAQAWGRCFTTYDPFAVYRLPGQDGQAQRSLSLSERYNRTHYYGWIGPEQSEDWAVVLCAPGGPEIMRTADAERTFDKLSNRKDR